MGLALSTGLGRRGELAGYRPNELITDSLNTAGMRNTKTRRARLRNRRMSQIAATLYMSAALCPNRGTRTRHAIYMNDVRVYAESQSHLFLTVLVLLGIAKTLKDRRLRWLSVSYIAAFSFYVIDVATDGFVKQLLTGFWYTDYYRTGAMTALFAIPLAALGFAWLVKLGAGLLGKMRFGRQDLTTLA